MLKIYNFLKICQGPCFVDGYVAAVLKLIWLVAQKIVALMALNFYIRQKKKKQGKKKKEKKKKLIQKRKLGPLGPLFLGPQFIFLNKIKFRFHKY